MSATKPLADVPMVLKHVSIFAPEHRLPHASKTGAFCCIHGTGSKRCRNIRIIDHDQNQTTTAERGQIDELLPALLEHRCKLGLDMMERWVRANLCKSHNCVANVRPIQYEKLGELGWSQGEIETRAGKIEE